MAQEAELILVDGRVTTLASDGFTPAQVPALAVRGGRVVFAGSNDEARAYAGAGTRVVDLGGRRVIPGLVDSHIHFVRAGLTWNDEVRWEGVADLAAGLGRITKAAGRLAPGQWIRVIGGWHPAQFADRAEPDRADLDRAAPGHPVFLQFGYDWGKLNSRAMQEIDLRRALAEGVDPACVDLDADGAPTGVVCGMAALRWLYWQLPEPTLEEQIASTAAASRELSRRGLTGVIDGGGSNSGPDVYRAVYETWRRGQLTLRTRLLVHAARPGLEREQLGGFLRYLHPRFGDDVLRVLGMGEIVHYGVHDGFEHHPAPNADVLAELTDVFEQCADKQWPVQIHTIRPETIELVLDAWERLGRPDAQRDLRWSLVHGEGIDAGQIERLAALGAGVLAPAMLRFEGEDLDGEPWDADRLAGAPPLRALIEAGVHVGGGTDAMRVASYDPFTALHWYVTGRTVSGRALWHPDNRLTREQALRIYTQEPAWFSFEERDRGSLQPGMLADLAVLDRDYFTVPEEEIPALQVELTLLGGRPTWVSDAFQDGFGDEAEREAP